MKNNNLTNQLDRIEKILTEQQDKPISFAAACQYLNVSKSYLYKLTCRKALAFYKPGGKKIFFLKKDLDDWIFKNRIKSESEIECAANSFLKNSNFNN